MGRYDVIARVNPLPVCIVGSVPVTLKTGGQSMAIAIARLRASVSRSRGAQKELIEVDLSEVQLETERLVMRMWRNDDFRTVFRDLFRSGSDALSRRQDFRSIGSVASPRVYRATGNCAVTVTGPSKRKPPERSLAALVF